MKPNPEKSLAKLWPSLVVEFWTTLRDQATKPALWSAYDREAALVGVPDYKRKEYQGENLHPGVKGATLACISCGRVFQHCHPREECFCPCSNPPTQLRPPKEVMKVSEATLRFYVKNQIPLK